MSKKTDIEKLRILLPHWIEHNQSHEEEFRKWEIISRENGFPETADLINTAIKHISDAGNALSRALDKIGGAAKGDHHHHH